MSAVIDGIIELNKSWMLQSSHNFDFSFHGSSVLLFCGVHHLSGEHQAAHFLLTSINGAKFSSVNRNDLVFTRLFTRKISRKIIFDHFIRFVFHCWQSIFLSVGHHGMYRVIFRVIRIFTWIFLCHCKEWNLIRWWLKISN